MYLLGTPKFLLLNVPKSAKVGDVIRHLLTVYQRDKVLTAGAPLAYPKAPDAYELRLIDEDKAEHVPDYSIGALDRRERVGQQEALAFVQVKGYKPKSNVS